MKSTKSAISEAAEELKQRTLEEFDLLMPMVTKQKACYGSSLLVQLFLRRVVEMYIVETCYPKVRMRRCCHLDHAESC